MDNTSHVEAEDDGACEYYIEEQYTIPYRKELTTFPVEKIISDPGDKMVAVKFDNTEKPEEKTFVFCHDFAWKGACAFGSNCKYPHGYEYVGLSSIAMQNDIIISKLNILLTNQDEILSKLNAIPCYGQKQSTHVNVPSSTTVNPEDLNVPSTSRTIQHESFKGRGRGFRRGRYTTRNRGRGQKNRSRSSSLERSTKGQTSQDLKLLNRLTRFQLKD